MHDNPQASSGLVFALPDHRLIALTGRDAATFAQAQFMNDVAQLEPGQWHWSGWLTPKGRVIALFALLKLSDEAIWLLLPDADPAALASGLKRFVFRSKVAIEVRADLHVSGAFTDPTLARGPDLAGSDAESGIELDMGAEAGPRAVRIWNGPVAPEDPAVARWQAFDLEHGLPRLPASQAEHWTPQQLSLERLGAFSVKKGCYPGQEIVARTHFLGQAKRGLALLEGDEMLVAGSDVSSESASLGKVIATAGADGRHLALAVVPLGHDSQRLSVDGNAVRELPVRGGLAR
ncbi:folate-binding protein YgfZ [Lysobacter niastensis]|uniref:Folate-binding protein YgfZ n=1 Tax=Lysobacter niastensis TaxID=380629 RepID=A0ABU1WE59_9GAMM|nr:folate-binding protein [Lysobacter niastensis]MDR7135891.1 folate-binding protein YgfZ [Lysobacter niastensis]